jgi:hypothetical protein
LIISQNKIINTKIKKKEIIDGNNDNKKMKVIYQLEENRNRKKKLDI